MEDELRAVDLFAGAGGLSEGLRSAGFRVILANEKQKDASLTYRMNHPDTKMVEGDIVEVGDSEVIPAIKGNLDLVAAGPPCQGFSMAGKRDINDKRNTLFKELVKIVREVQPKFFLMENVKGLLSMDGGRVIKVVESAFIDEGYKVKTYLLNAVWFGVPQFRERVFILGKKDGTIPLAPSPSCKKETTVGEAISDLDFLDSGESSTVYQKESESEYQRMMRRKTGKCDLRNHETPRHTQKVSERFSLFKEGQTMKDIPEEWRTQKMIVYRFDRKRPSRTLTTLPDDFIHYSRNRIPTVREYARIQSFPDHYVFYGPKSTGGLRRRTDVPQYSQVGNAVPCLLAQAVGESIKAQLLNPKVCLSLDILSQ
jgi:DNA (cytosine-5)-methyltransferase 1